MVVGDDIGDEGRTRDCLTDWFELLIGLHTRSVPSPVLTIVLLPLTYCADDLILIAEDEDLHRQKPMTRMPRFWKLMLIKGLFNVVKHVQHVNPCVSQQSIF